VTVAALLCASVGVRVAAQEQTMFCQRLRFKHAVGGTCSQDDGEAMEFEFGRCGKNREEVDGFIAANMTGSAFVDKFTGEGCKDFYAVMCQTILGDIAEKAIANPNKTLPCRAYCDVSTNPDFANCVTDEHCKDGVENPIEPKYCCGWFQAYCVDVNEFALKAWNTNSVCTTTAIGCSPAHRMQPPSSFALLRLLPLLLAVALSVWGIQSRVG